MNLPDSLPDRREVLQKIFDLLHYETIIINQDYEIMWMNKEKIKKHPALRNGDKCYKPFGNDSPCSFCLMEQAEELRGSIKNPICLNSGNKGKSIEHINIQISPIYNKDGNLFGFIEIIDNVENIYQTNIRLEYLNKEYESVIYALSHDLRSPLVSIEGFLRKLLKNHIDLNNEEAMHCVDRIHANVETMNSLVKVLLDTSRIATGTLDIRDVNINSLVESVVNQLHLNENEKYADIKIKGKFGIVKCDEIRIKQVFRNLLNNILEHCSSNKDLKIEIGAENNIFWVKDNGPGIPEHIIDRVFEPFFQGEKVDKNSFGMGMNIVYNIIEKHGGRIWIDSIENAGTTVFFTLE